MNWTWLLLSAELTSNFQADQRPHTVTKKSQWTGQACCLEEDDQLSFIK